MRSGSTFLQSFSSLSPACLETNTLYFTGQPRIGQLNALESAFQFAQAFFSSSSISRLIATTPDSTFSMLSSGVRLFCSRRPAHAALPAHPGAQVFYEFGLLLRAIPPPLRAGDWVGEGQCTPHITQGRLKWP